MRLGFIGIGKIASSVIEGLCTSGIKDLTISLSPRNERNAAGLAAKYPNITRLQSNQDVLDQSDIIIIALVPAAARVVLPELKFESRHTVISVIALVNYAELVKLLYPATDICRAIPLPPVVQHNCPIPLYQANAEVVKLFGHIGQTLIVADEHQLHVIWTLTGLITPFYDQLKTLSDWTITNGVDKQIANRYIANMYQSLAFMAQQTNPIEFDELAKHATTPNGMNEQAGKEIRETGTHQAYATASDNLLKRFE
jgi:pyrroline-5-carboxylate reductase